MSEFLDQMSGILSRAKKVEPAKTIPENVQPETVEQPTTKLVECHFVMNDSMRRIRHIAMRLHEGKLLMWSCKGKPMNPTMGLRESISSHAPQSIGVDRFDREETFRLKMESAFLSANNDVDSIQESLNEYTGGNWKLFKRTFE